MAELIDIFSIFYRLNDTNRIGKTLSPVAGFTRLLTKEQLLSNDKQVLIDATPLERVVKLFFRDDDNHTVGTGLYMITSLNILRLTENVLRVFPLDQQIFEYIGRVGKHQEFNGIGISVPY